MRLNSKEIKRIINKYRDRLDENEYTVVRVKSDNCFLVDDKYGQRQTVTFIK